METKPEEEVDRTREKGGREERGKGGREERGEKGREKPVCTLGQGLLSLVKKFAAPSLTSAIAPKPELGSKARITSEPGVKSDQRIKSESGHNRNKSESGHIRESRIKIEPLPDPEAEEVEKRKRRLLLAVDKPSVGRSRTERENKGEMEKGREEFRRVRLVEGGKSEQELKTAEITAEQKIKKVEDKIKSRLMNVSRVRCCVAWVFHRFIQRLGYRLVCCNIKLLNCFF